MSAVDKAAPSNKATKESLAVSDKLPGGYLSALAGGKTPISMPPIPAWMLNTAMYSKLPMLPAPKGKITLYTTGLGEKLYPTPSGLDFDPNAEGLISEYKSLHDPHLKSHYIQPTTFHNLIKKKFITPEGKVICTLKEFNDYHQYLKRVHIEKVAQDRTTVAREESKERVRQRQEWTNKEELSPHDKHILAIQARKRKMLKEQHRRASQQMEEDEVRHMRLIEAKQTKRSIDKARSNLEREKKRNKKIRLEIEEHMKRVTKRVALAQDESRHAELLKCYRMNTNDKRQLKLLDQWNRHQSVREQHRHDGAMRQAEMEASTQDSIQARQESLSQTWSQQHSTFESIRDTRAMKIQSKEAKIQARLERKLNAVRKRFERRRRKTNVEDFLGTGGQRYKVPRHGLGGPRHHSTWPIQGALDKMQLSPADGVWKIDYEKYLPMCSPVLSPVQSPTVVIEPKSVLPSISRRGEDTFEQIQEEEEKEEEGQAASTGIHEDDALLLSSAELSALFGDQHETYITTARELVANVFQALETEKHSREPGSAVDVREETAVCKETRLPGVMRRSSVLELTSSTVARLVLSKAFRRAREQVLAEGGLPQTPSPTPIRLVASDTGAALIPKQLGVTQRTSEGDVPSRASAPSQGHTSSSLLAVAVVSDALRKVTRELEEEARQESDTSVLAEDLVWDTIRTVTDQLHGEMARTVSQELEQTSDTSLLADDLVQEAIRNVTSELQKELSDSGTSLIAERVVSDAIRTAARHLREMPLRGSGASLLAEEMASNAIRSATRQLQVLLPQSSSSLIAEAIAADAVKNVMRQLGQRPPQSSSSILAQAFAADALKSVKRRLDNEEILAALGEPAHPGSSLLATAITNDSLKKATRQLQRKQEAAPPRRDSSLLAEAVANDALTRAAAQLESERSHPIRSDSSLLAQVVTREALHNAALHLQIEKRMQAPQTSSSLLAQDAAAGALQNAVTYLAGHDPKPARRSSSRLAPVMPDDALQAARQQLKSERANSRCRSRGSRSASPFSPELAKSAINQTSPEPTQGSVVKTRAVASDIIKPDPPGLESALPTKDDHTPPPSPALHTAASDSQKDINKVDNVASSQSRVNVKHAVSDDHKKEADEMSQVGLDVVAHRSSILLAAVHEVFEDDETDITVDHEAAPDDDTSSESEVEDEIIGVVENEIIAEEESVHSLAECLEGSRVEGLTSVVKKSHDKTIFEGAVIPHDKTHESVTEKVLSVEDLHADNSGHLVHDLDARSDHRVSEAGECSQKAVGSQEACPGPHGIVPVYHNHPLDLDEEIISHNLSAISIKPDDRHRVPPAYSASGRNSFRNVFRPDMSHCQGSAKCLKDTLVDELSHAHDEQRHAVTYAVLDQPHEDIGAHHSDEELVGHDEAEGVCYLPRRKTYQVHEVVDDTVIEEPVAEEGCPDAEGETTPHSPPEPKDTPAGGDFRSPDEREVGAASPVSRHSSRSLRSGNSRDVHVLRAATRPEELPATASERPTETASSQSAAETKTTTQAASSSRSLLGAVIERLSSIFSRKRSVRIHPGATDEAAYAPTGEAPADLALSGSIDLAREARDDISYEDQDAAEQELALQDEAIGEETVDAEESSPPCAATEFSKGEERKAEEEVRDRDSQGAPRIQTPDGPIDTKSANDVPETKPQDESEEEQLPQCFDLQEKQRLSTASLKEDENQIEVEAQEPAIESDVRLKLKSDVIVVKESEEKQCGKLLGKEELGTSDKEHRDPDVPQKSTPESKDLEQKQEASKKVLKAESDSVVGKTSPRNGGTPKTCVSQSAAGSRQRTPPGSLSGRLLPRASKSPSPKPRGRSLSPYSLKAQAVLGPGSGGQRQSPGDKRSGKGSSSSTASSAPGLPKQRSRVSKPPSSGSVRLIKVSPAPSMASARRQSASLGKLMSGKGSGGSVRLINVSPAASTAIGSRRSASNSGGARPSASDAKGSRPSSSAQASISAPRIQTKKASTGSLRSESKVRANKPTADSQPAATIDARRQASPTHVQTVPSSGSSFVIIQTPVEMPPIEERAPVPDGPPPGSTEPQPPRPGEQDQPSEEQDPSPDSSPAAPVEDPAKSPGDEQPQRASDEAAKPQSTDDAEEPDSLQQTEASHQQPEEVSPATDVATKDEATAKSSSDETIQTDQEARSSSDCSADRQATRTRRSRSLISAVIERLSRMFSKEGRSSASATAVDRRSGAEAGAVSPGIESGGERGIPESSQSTGALDPKQTAARGHDSLPELQSQPQPPQTTKQHPKGATSSEAGSKSNISPASLAVPPNSAASDSSVNANATATSLLVTTTHATGSNKHSAGSAGRRELDRSNDNNNLPPVEDVDVSKQPTVTQGRPMTSSKDE